MEVEYSLYLVTGRELLPEGKALQGGVTVVQVREKKSDTLEFLQIAQQSKTLCEEFGVPLIINDRIDIALAVDADGVHLGQTDMPVHVARKLLPPGKIIGVSCNNIDHIKKAVEDGVDYVGIGAVWATNTKQLTSPVLGDFVIRTLGGIKSDNILRTLHGSVSTTGHRLDGVAVVSDIVASPEPLRSAQILKNAYMTWLTATDNQAVALSAYTAESIRAGVADLMRAIKETSPLVHQITNVVVTNQSANATLALGASPIMATAPEEMYDLSRVLGALLINFGTVKDKEGMLLAGQFVNEAKKPVIFDPVGVGATQFRRKTAAELLNTWQASVIKGNAGELAALADSKEASRGVDSLGSGFADPARFVRNLARREPWNGHSLLGDITGSGCLVGTCIATFCAGAWARAKNEDSTGKIVQGDIILALTIAGERAAVRSDVLGSGTFLPALIDELYNLTPETVLEWAQVHVVPVAGQ
ncbi:Hydroxyethylthiazole kinase family-domain-containing protein [Melanogaster broomeanus]|nr:Hydroxyethylthiazole kinase family-domain-containing protein [Melanogaster broomeanus]